MLVIVPCVNRSAWLNCPFKNSSSHNVAYKCSGVMNGRVLVQLSHNKRISIQNMYGSKWVHYPCVNYPGISIKLICSLLTTVKVGCSAFLHQYCTFTVKDLIWKCRQGILFRWTDSIMHYVIIIIIIFNAVWKKSYVWLNITKALFILYSSLR